MASRTIQTSDEVDAALKYLGSRENPQVGAEQYFQTKITNVINEVLAEANEKQFDAVTVLMKSEDKGKSIKQLRELLGV